MTNEEQGPSSSRPSGYIFADSPKLKAREYRTTVSSRRVAVGGTLLALLVLVIFVAAILGGPNSQEFLTHAFGATPFGFPVVVVVPIVLVVLLLPFLFSLYHLVRIAAFMAADHGLAGQLMTVAYLFSGDDTVPELRRSRIYSLLGLGYFVALLAGWIWYTAARGI